MFSNINRVKIVKLLKNKGAMAVVYIARELDISPKSTSKHLIMLDRFEVLNSRGVSGHVFYEINQNMPRDIKEVIDLFM